MSSRQSMATKMSRFTCYHHKTCTKQSKFVIITIIVISVSNVNCSDSNPTTNHSQLANSSGATESPLLFLGPEEAIRTSISFSPTNTSSFFTYERLIDRYNFILYNLDRWLSHDAEKLLQTILKDEVDSRDNQKNSSSNDLSTEQYEADYGDEPKVYSPPIEAAPQSDFLGATSRHKREIMPTDVDILTYGNDTISDDGQNSFKGRQSRNHREISIEQTKTQPARQTKVVKPILNLTHMKLQSDASSVRPQYPDKKPKSYDGHPTRIAKSSKVQRTKVSLGATLPATISDQGALSDATQTSTLDPLQSYTNQDGMIESPLSDMSEPVQTEPTRFDDLRLSNMVTNMAQKGYQLDQSSDTNSANIGNDYALPQFESSIGSSRVKHNRQKTANLLAANTDPAVGYSTQIPSPDQNALRGDQDNQSTDNLITDAPNAFVHLNNLADGASKQHYEPQDPIVPQVGDLQVQEQPSLGKNEPHNALSERQKLKQLIHLYQSDSFPRRRKKQNANYNLEQLLDRPLDQNHVESEDFKNSTNRARSNAPYVALNSGLFANPNENQVQQLISRHNETNQPNSEIQGQIYGTNLVRSNRMYSHPISVAQIQPLFKYKTMDSENGANIEDNFYNTNIKHSRRAAGNELPLRSGPKQVNRNKFVHSSGSGGWLTGPRLKASESRPYIDTASLNLDQHLQLPITANGLHGLSQVDPLQDSQADRYGAGSIFSPQSQVLGLIRSAGPIVDSLTGPQQYNPTQPLSFSRRGPLLVNYAGPQNRLLKHSQMQASNYALYPPSPYSTTSSRYIKQASGPNQRLMYSSPQRMGRVANSNYSLDESNFQGLTPAAASPDPIWSESQSQEDDYQQSPQTIQITAVPNGVGLNNGLVNGFNGWNGWGGPWNGRQVLLVNRQPPGTEWRQWILPVAVILALPLVLGALFVPVFLKSVMFLIQILQMLGLLMPPGQLAGHLSAASSHLQSAG